MTKLNNDQITFLSSLVAKVNQGQQQQYGNASATQVSGPFYQVHGNHSTPHTFKPSRTPGNS